MELLPCENPMKWALCCISIQQFLFPKGGIAAFFMPVGDVDKGQKPYYNDTRMQRELLREAERKDTSTFTPDLDNANGGNVYHVFDKDASASLIFYMTYQEHEDDVFSDYGQQELHSGVGFLFCVYNETGSSF